MGAAMLWPIDALIASLKRIGDAAVGIGMDGIGAGLASGAAGGCGVGVFGGSNDVGEETGAAAEAIDTADAVAAEVLLAVCASVDSAASRSATLTIGRSGMGGAARGRSTREASANALIGPTSISAAAFAGGEAIDALVATTSALVGTAIDAAI